MWYLPAHAAVARKTSRMATPSVLHDRRRSKDDAAHLVRHSRDVLDQLIARGTQGSCLRRSDSALAYWTRTLWTRWERRPPRQRGPKVPGSCLSLPRQVRRLPDSRGFCSAAVLAICAVPRLAATMRP